MLSVSKKLMSIVSEITRDALSVCASKYNFNAEEAWCLVNESIELSVGGGGRGRGGDKGSRKRSNTPVKKVIPLPYNGECNDSNCQALRQNKGLYTQCDISRNGESSYCSSCEKQLVDGAPIYGTISQRKAVGIMDYVAPNGKKPVSYTTIMKKYNISQEQAIEAAGKLNITIDPIHFEVADRKRGRRKVEKEPKEVKEPKSKGRPKKTKKVIEIGGGDESDDLFASLVANLSISDDDSEKKSVSDSVSDVESVSESEDDANKEAKKAEKEAKKAEKEAKKAEKEAKKEEADKKKAEKEAKKAEAETKKAEKEAKKAEAETKKAEKEAKKEEAETKKAEKEAKKAEKEEKNAEKKVTKKVIEEEDEPEVVKKITQDGKKYLKSKNTGVIYDHDKYVSENEQVVVGKWNETTQKIDFTNDEESEEEYESDDE
jgi:hypothetical protein